MTFGNPRWVAAVAGGLLSMAAVSRVEAHPQPWGVPALLHTLSRGVSHEVRFVEVNHLASLRHPIRAHGTLQFRKPHTLIMTQSAPHKAVYRIEGNRLFVNHSERGVPVSRYPGVIAIVSGFEGLLSGNYALLAHDFKTRLQGTPQSWRLTLHPRLAALKRALTSVMIRGQGARLVTIKTRAPNGDFSDMHILP